MSRSAPNIPTNNLTTDTISLPSATGFNVGDLVYYKDGDYKALPANALTSATFDVIKNNPTYQQPVGSTITNRINGGGSKGNYSAVLTNGNVVSAYIDYSTFYPTFVITNTAGTIVVAATTVSSTFIGNSNHNTIGVSALSGGGFVVYWTPAQGGTILTPYYAIYDNTGAIVTAVTADSAAGASTTGAFISGVALPNGGFALSYVVASGLVVKTRAYSSTGVASFAWTTVTGAAFATTQAITMAARSDSSYIVAFQNTSTIFRYSIYSYAGSVLNFSNFTSTIGTTALSNAPISVSTLNDGTTFVIGYISFLSSVAQYSCFRFLPSSNVLSAESYIPPANTNITQNSNTFTSNQFAIVVCKISSGGFFLAFTDRSYAINYAFFDNSGNPISGTNLSGALTFPIPGSAVIANFMTIGAIEYGGNINLFWQPDAFNVISPFIQTSAISTTTYQLITTQSISENLGTVISPVNGVANTTTPGSALFLASANSTQVLTNTMGFSRLPNTINNINCDSVRIASLSNGGFVIVYRARTAPYPVTALVYDCFGSVIQTIAVGNGLNTSTVYNIDVTVLTNGSLVICVMSASNTATFYLYTALNNTYTLAGTLVRNDVTNTAATIRISLTAITNNRFVFGYTRTTNSFLTYIVFDSSLNILSGPNNITGSNGDYLNLNALNGGGFSAFYKASGGTFQNSYFGNFSGNTFTNISNVGYGVNLAGEFVNSVMTPGNILVSTTAVTSPTSFGITSFSPATNVAGALITYTSITDYRVGTCVGITGAGSVILVCFNATSTQGFAKAYNAGLNGLNSAVYSAGSSYFTFDTPSNFSGTGFSQLCSAPGPGYNSIFAWLDVNGFPTYAIFYAYPSTTTSTITSGVTASAPQPITAYSNQALSGYVLQGVAVTSAPAGGVGQVQTNGIARLNSNYSSSTPASSFDFQTPNGTNISGVKGTAIGNTVILEGKV